MVAAAATADVAVGTHQCHLRVVVVEATRHRIGSTARIVEESSKGSDRSDPIRLLALRGNHLLPCLELRWLFDPLGLQRSHQLLAVAGSRAKKEMESAPH